MAAKKKVEKKSPAAAKKAAPKAAAKAKKPAAPVKAKAAVKAAPEKEKKSAPTKVEKVEGKKKSVVGMTSPIPEKTPRGKGKPPRSNFEEDPDAPEGEPEEETELLEEEVEDEVDIDGPPPWWKDNPAGMEGPEDDASAPGKFDDSDEWSEEDEEDWSTGRKTTIEELEGSDEEDDERW